MQGTVFGASTGRFYQLFAADRKAEPTEKNIPYIMTQPLERGFNNYY